MEVLQAITDAPPERITMSITGIDRSKAQTLRLHDETAQPDEIAANILLVDDYPANLAALEAILDPLGHKLIKVSSSRQAIEVLAREEVAVVLMDVRAPGVDGFKASQLMRSSWRSGPTPVIFLTVADSDLGSILDEYTKGAVDFLVKPFEPEILRCKVSVFVELFLKEQTIRRAEAANRIKDEFLATVSHELRNPLNAIIGWVHLLRTGNLDPAKSKRALETIERNVHLQVSLIDEILDLSRIAKGKVHLTLRIVDMVPLIESALDAMRPTAEAKGLILKWEWNGPPVCVSGDSERLQQVISNLISNAVKFTPPSGRVSVTLERNEDAAALVVSDTGKGISAEFLPFVFDMFRQMGRSITREHRGLGFRLAIARKLVELHGGRISAKSEGLGKGATFSVSLPLQVSQATDEQQPGSQSSEMRPRALQGIRILVVEDHGDSREALTEHLRRLGADITIAESAQEALAAVGRQVPDVLINNIAMSGKDGFSLMRSLSQQARKPPHRIVSIALTGMSDPQDAQRALQAGFDICMLKPLDLGNLVANILRRLSSDPSVT